MGEYADAMLDGDCCQQCGVPFASSGDGYPRTCSECSPEGGDSLDETDAFEAEAAPNFNWKDAREAKFTRAKGHITKEAAAIGYTLKVSQTAWVFRYKKFPAVVWHPRTGACVGYEDIKTWPEMKAKLIEIAQKREAK